jgi:hypothetical protein
LAGQNAAAFRAVVDAVARRDSETLVALAHSGVEGETLRSAVQGPWHGHVLAIGSIHVRSGASGVELDVPSAVVVEFRDGLMYRYKDYGDADLARAAIG